MNLAAEILQAIRYHLDNRRAALGTIRWLKHFNIAPATLVDAGAHNSEWMRYLARAWPDARVISFEPQRRCRPIGTWIQVALSHREGTGSMASEPQFESRWMRGGSSHVRRKCRAVAERVKIMRLDSYANQFLPPAVLKVDCEDHTLRVLRGAGALLGSFVCVVAEVFEDALTARSAVPNCHMEIHKLMARHGFDRAMTVAAIPWLTSVSQTDVLFWRSSNTPGIRAPGTLHQLHIPTQGCH